MEKLEKRRHVIYEGTPAETHMAECVLCETSFSLCLSARLCACVLFLCFPSFFKVFYQPFINYGYVNC